MRELAEQIHNAIGDLGCNGNVLGARIERGWLPGFDRDGLEQESRLRRSGLIQLQVAAKSPPISLQRCQE